MLPMRYFLVKLKEEKLKPGRKNGRIRMTKKEITALMERKQWICIDGLIYNRLNRVVGSLIVKTVNRKDITEYEFKSLPMREIMLRLGSLDANKWEKTRSIGIKYKDDLDLGA